MWLISSPPIRQNTTNAHSIKTCSNNIIGVVRGSKSCPSKQSPLLPLVDAAKEAAEILLDLMCSPALLKNADRLLVVCNKTDSMPDELAGILPKNLVKKRLETEIENLRASRSSGLGDTDENSESMQLEVMDAAVDTQNISLWTSKLRRQSIRCAYLWTRTLVHTHKHQGADKLYMQHTHFFDPIPALSPFSLAKPHKHLAQHTADPLYSRSPHTRSRARCSSGAILLWHQNLSTTAQSKTASAPSQTLSVVWSRS